MGEFPSLDEVVHGDLEGVDTFDAPPDCLQEALQALKQGE
jgi:hypothetical protein